MITLIMFVSIIDHLRLAQIQITQVQHLVTHNHKVIAVDGAGNLQPEHIPHHFIIHTSRNGIQQARSIILCHHRHLPVMLAAIATNIGGRTPTAPRFPIGFHTTSRNDKSNFMCNFRKCRRKYTIAHSNRSFRFQHNKINSTAKSRISYTYHRTRNLHAR